MWWDREIQPGRPFDEAIEEALNSASCLGALRKIDAGRTRFTIRRREAELTLDVDCPICRPS